MEKYYYDIGVKITNKRRMSRSITNNKQNVEKTCYSPNCTSPFCYCSHSGGHLGRGAASSVTSIFLQCTGTMCLLIWVKALGFSLCHHKGFHLQPAALPPSKTVIPSLKALKPDTDLAFLWVKVLSVILF